MLFSETGAVRLSVGAGIGRRTVGGRRRGFRIGRYWNRLSVGAAGGGLSDRQAVDGSILRSVVASIGPAAGIGSAVGIELRRALQ